MARPAQSRGRSRSGRSRPGTGQTARKSTSAPATAASPATPTAGSGAAGPRGGTLTATVLPATHPTGATPPASTARTIAQRLLSGLSTTPGRLQLAALVTILLALVFGLAGLGAASSRADTLDRARADVQQLVLIEGAHTDLVRADAEATTAFLVGGLEPPAQRKLYAEHLEAAAQQITRAAASGTADADRLTKVSAGLARYTGLVEQARANNRQGFPLGAAYLKQASAGLRADVLPLLAELAEADKTRIAAALDGGSTAGLWLITGGVLLALGLLQLWLSARTRRTVNLGLAVASIAVLVSSTIAAAVLSGIGATVDGVRAGTYAAVVHLSDARVAAFDAKSNESLTLVARGSGDAFDKAFDAAFASARTAVQDAEVAGVAQASTIEAALADWQAQHATLRGKDSEGDWDGAVALATTPDGGTSAPFERFDTTTEEALRQAAADADAGLAEPGGTLSGLAVSLFVAGLFAAAAGWSGLRARWKEYP